MAIPRNLVYVFAGVIVFAFLGMLYIVYTEKDLKSFMSLDPFGKSGEVIVKEDVVVHPLFWHLRNSIQQIDEVPRTPAASMDTRRFY